ncbi:MAG: HEAT repeat domain-containing protein [bacterium]|nr:HEAT repeat domain-containing protein [bacterium]
MNRVAWITLLVVGPVAGFVIGATVAKSRKPEAVSVSPRTEIRDKGADAGRVKDLRADLEKYRLELAGRENEVRELREELADARERIPSPLSPEEEEKRREFDQWKERRERSERLRNLHEKSNEIRKKILQRKDPFLRQQGLLELEALVKSDDKEDMLLGLTALWRLGGFDLDKETFKPYALAALKHEDVEVRKAAFNSLYAVCPQEDQLDTVLSMLRDPSPEMRLEAVSRCGWLGGDERREEVASTLKALLQDQDKSVQKKVLDELWRHHFQYDYGSEIEDLVIELSRDPELTDATWEWMQRRGPVSVPMAERLIEMHGERRSAYDILYYTRQNLSEEARPIITGFCLRLVRESVEPWERQEVLRKLQELGDPSVIPELEAIARSPDAEGIENHLAETIEQIRRRSSQPR